MPATTIADERTYDDDTFTACEVSRIERSRTGWGYFEPGQFIPVHAPDSELTVVVQSGHGIVPDGDETHDVGPGSVVTVPAGQNRGIKAGIR